MLEATWSTKNVLCGETLHKLMKSHLRNRVQEFDEIIRYIPMEVLPPTPAPPHDPSSPYLAAATDTAAHRARVVRARNYAVAAFVLTVVLLIIVVALGAILGH